jgi:hypothetical protein
VNQLTAKAKAKIKLLHVGIVLVVLGVGLFCGGFYNYSVSQDEFQKISTATGTSSIQFTPSFNETNTVIISVNGSYNISNSTYLRITSTTGFSERTPVVEFPIEVQLSNAGQYTHLF